MDLKTVIDTAKHARNEAARTMDTLGTGGQGAEQARTAIRQAVYAAGYGGHTVEQSADTYVRALRHVQDLNEQLYEATGGLADAAGHVNRRLSARNVPAIF
jgi:hypothetical protein